MSIEDTSLKALLLRAGQANAGSLVDAKEELFPQMVDLGDSEVEQVLKALKQATGASLGALRQDWRDYLAANGLLESREDSVGTVIVKLVQAAGVELWHDPQHAAWLSCKKGGHTEHHPLRSKTAKRFLAKLYHDQHKKAAHSQALQDAIQTLEADAVFNGEQHQTFVRVGEADGNIYLDLANENWEIVEITPEGWRILSSDKSAVRFRRPKGISPLPSPATGGDLKTLAALLDFDDIAWPLVAGWLVGALHPTGPYPVLVFEGEQGSGKSTKARLLRELIDPNVAGLRTLPRNEDDLIIAANNGHVVNFDNLSGLPPWLSDALCRLSTGGGLAKRELYTDAEEVIFSARRPMILNGIDAIATRHDLAERAIVVELPPIPPDRRKAEKAVVAEFEHRRPGILGALLDAVSCALRNQDTLKLDALPRMADFVHFVVAAEPAMGLEAGEFLAAYESNRQGMVVQSLGTDPVAQAILGFLDDKCMGLRWQGTASEMQRAAWIPNVRGARGLTNALRRIAPALLMTGVRVTFTRQKQRLIILERVSNPASAASATSEPVPDRAVGNDAVSPIIDDRRDVASSAKAGNHAPPALADAADATSPPPSNRDKWRDLL